MLLLLLASCSQQAGDPSVPTNWMKNAGPSEAAEVAFLRPPSQRVLLSLLLCSVCSWILKSQILTVAFLKILLHCYWKDHFYFLFQNARHLHPIASLPMDHQHQSLFQEEKETRCLNLLRNVKGKKFRSSLLCMFESTYSTRKYGQQDMGLHCWQTSAFIKKDVI